MVIFPEKVAERKKRITKEKHGISHKFTWVKMKEYLGKVNTDRIEKAIVGTGQHGKLGLLDETKKLMVEKEIDPVEHEAPRAIDHFKNREEPREKKLGTFHVIC